MSKKWLSRLHQGMRKARRKEFSGKFYLKHMQSDWQEQGSRNGFQAQSIWRLCSSHSHWNLPSHQEWGHLIYTENHPFSVHFHSHVQSATRCFHVFFKVNNCLLSVNMKVCSFKMWEQKEFILLNSGLAFINPVPILVAL